MRPVRVLSVQHYPVFGGPHNEILRLEPALRALGIETLVAHTDQPGNALSRLEGQVEVHRIRLDRLHMAKDPRVHARSLLNGAGDIARLRKLIRDLDVDIVKVHGPHNPHGAIAARLERKPVVWVVSSTRVPKAFRFAGSHLVKCLADSILVTGKAVVDAYKPLHDCRERIVPYYPPVDTELFKPSTPLRRATRADIGVSDAVPLVGMVANVNPQKGVEYFVRAAARIRDAIPEVRFLLVGSNYETQKAYAALIQAEIDACGLGDALVRTGGRSDTERLYPAMDVELLTSVPDSEGAPTTVIEAMACGVPVVATDVGSVRELIDDGSTGFVVPSLDVTEIARRCIELLRAPNLRLRLGLAGRERALANFDVAVCAATHMQAYELALGRAIQRPVASTAA
jgi:glycosyltransferase involved in cell wall biosynthesis